MPTSDTNSTTPTPPNSDVFINTNLQLPTGLTLHKQDPNLVIFHNAPGYPKLPIQLLNTLATYWYRPAVERPTHFLQGATKLLVDAATEIDDSRKSFKTLPPQLQNFLCSKYRLSVLGQNPFTLTENFNPDIAPPILNRQPTCPQLWKFRNFGTSLAPQAFMATFDDSVKGTSALVRLHLTQAINSGKSAILAIVDSGNLGSKALCRKYHTNGCNISDLLTIAKWSFPIGNACGFPNDSREEAKAWTNEWSIKNEWLQTPQGYNPRQLVRNPNTQTEYCIYILYARPFRSPALLWSTQEVHQLTEITHNSSYWKGPYYRRPPTPCLYVHLRPHDRKLLGLNESTHNSSKSDITLDAHRLLGDAWRRSTLTTLIPDQNLHFPKHPLAHGSPTMTPEQLIAGSILLTDLQITSSMNLPKALARLLTVEVAHDLLRYDVFEEHAWEQSQYAMYKELGIELSQGQHHDVNSTNHPIDLHSCAICESLHNQLYIIRPSDGPAATKSIQQAALLWAKQTIWMPKKCTCKDILQHQNTCVKDHNYLNNRLIPSFMATIAPGGVAVCYGCFSGAPLSITELPIRENPEDVIHVPSPLAERSYIKWTKYFINCAVQQKIHKSKTTTTPDNNQNKAVADSRLARTKSLSAGEKLQKQPLWNEPINGNYTLEDVRSAILLDMFLASTSPLARVLRPSAKNPSLSMAPRNLIGSVHGNGKDATVVTFIGPSVSTTEPVTNLYVWLRLKSNIPDRKRSLVAGSIQARIFSQADIPARPIDCANFDDLMAIAAIQLVTKIQCCQIQNSATRTLLQSLLATTDHHPIIQNNQQHSIDAQFQTPVQATAAVKRIRTHIAEAVKHHVWTMPTHLVTNNDHTNWELSFNTTESLIIRPGNLQIPNGTLEAPARTPATTTSNLTKYPLRSRLSAVSPRQPNCPALPKAVPNPNQHAPCSDTETDDDSDCEDDDQSWVSTEAIHQSHEPILPQGWPPNFVPPTQSSPQNASSSQLLSLATTTPTNRNLAQHPIVQYSSSILGQSARPSEAAEIAAAALHMVKPNHVTMTYGTLTPTDREEATTGQQQPEYPLRKTTTKEDQTIEPALGVVKRKGKTRGGKHLPGHQRKTAKEK